MKINTRFWPYIADFLLEGEMFQTTFVEKNETHVCCPITFFFLENRAINEMMWKSIAAPDRTGWQYGACALNIDT
jgi:hypothetical protein